MCVCRSTSILTVFYSSGFLRAAVNRGTAAATQPVGRAPSLSPFSTSRRALHWSRCAGSRARINRSDSLPCRIPGIRYRGGRQDASSALRCRRPLSPGKAPISLTWKPKWLRPTWPSISSLWGKTASVRLTPLRKDAVPYRFRWMSSMSKTFVEPGRLLRVACQYCQVKGLRLRHDRPCFRRRSHESPNPAIFSRGKVYDTLLSS